MCPMNTLSIALVMSTFQLNWFPNAVMIAVPVAVVVIGVGRSFAPFSVALKISTPDGIPVESFVHATPTAAMAANTTNACVTRIPVLLGSLQVDSHQASEPAQPSFRRSGVIER